MANEFIHQKATERKGKKTLKNIYKTKCISTLSINECHEKKNNWSELKSKIVNTSLLHMTHK